jgi:hypothetical protein
MSPQRATQAKTEGIYSALFDGSLLKLGSCGASRHGQYDADAVTAIPDWNAERPICSTALENMAHKSHIWDRVKVSVEYESCPGAEGWLPLFLSLSRFVPCASIAPNEQALDRKQEATEVRVR